LDDKLQNLWFHLPESGAVKPETAVERIAAFFEKHAEYAEYQPMVDASPDTLGFKPGYSVKVNFWGPLPSQADADRLAAMLTDDLRSVAGKLSLERHYHYAGSVKDRYENPSVDALSVYFEKNGLDRIRNFEDYLKAESARDADNPAQILMDVNQVKEKENFNFLSKVTLVISVLLVCFSALAIMLFIFNLLKSHLSRVSMNIGTFKALGLSDAEARRIYFTIILVFILSGIVSAFILSGISGTVVNALMKRNLVIDAEIDYFKLFDWKTALMIAVVLSSSLLTSWLTIRKLLNKTPGDLIYNR
jgi:ABC-type antimicrobial peptide transport system permease subunit